MSSKLLQIGNDVRPNLLEKNIYKIESPYDLTDDVVTKSLNLLQSITGYDYRNNGVVDIVERLIDAENSQLVIIGGERLLVEFGRRAANNVLGKFIPSPTNLVKDLKNIFKGNFSKSDGTITDITKDPSRSIFDRVLQTGIGYRSNENFLDKEYGKYDYTETSDVNYKYSGNMIKEKIGQLNKKSIFSTYNIDLSKIDFQIQSSTFRNTYSEDFISNTNNSIYNDGNANRITETFTTTYFTTPYEKNEDNLIKNYHLEKIDIENAQGFGEVTPAFIKDSRVFNDSEIALQKVKNDGGNSNIEAAGENTETFRYSSAYRLQEKINSQYGVKRGLVYFTSKLANENNIIAHDEKELYKENISFGSETIYWKGNGECRTFTIYDQYDNYNRVIKFNGNNENNSVLRDKVLPRIAPTTSDLPEDKYNYFFTMENLALKESGLEECEKGPNGGRWMWFPPYDVKLSDNNSVSWSDMNFLGRPEPIFSYQNTMRTLSLSFRLLIDTVKNIQDVKPAIDNYYKYLYACNADNSIYKTKTIKKENIIPIQIVTTSSTIDKKPSIVNKSKYYFKNDGFVLNITTPVYSTGGELASASTKNNNFLAEFNLSVNSLKELMLNKDVIEINLQFKGVATALITQELSTEKAKEYNRALGMKRADNLMRNIIAKYDTIRGDAPKIEITKFKDNGKPLAASSEVGGQVIGVDIPPGTVIPNEFRSYSQIINGKKINLFLTTTGADNSKPNPDKDPLAKKVNDDNRIKQRYAIIESIDYKIQTIKENRKIETKKETVEEQVPLNRGTETPEPCDSNLSLEFQSLEEDNKFPTGFEKLNTFSPVFNSQTPFDFTKRYTFLHQLTRPSKLNNLTPIDNTVFGRMPVFVIRYGDFIYSKAIARSINFDITDSTWDLNPEGMGAIPLYCNVTMDLTLLGGQSLAGPIDRIQTANDSNFIANSTFNSGYYTGNKTFEKARKQEQTQWKKRASGPKKPIPGSLPDSGNKPQDAPTFNLIKAENRGTLEPFKFLNSVTRSEIIEEEVVGPASPAILQRYIDKDKAIRDARELIDSQQLELLNNFDLSNDPNGLIEGQQLDLLYNSGL